MPPFVTDFAGIPYDIKDPASTLDYAIDWGPWLAARADTIASVAWQATGCTVTTSSFSGGVTSVWLSGGTTGTVANIKCTITTAAGRICARTFNLRIQAQ